MNLFHRGLVNLAVLTLLLGSGPSGSVFAGTGEIDSGSSPKPVSVPTISADDASFWWNGPTLTGDWNGFRTQLENHGVNPYLYYTAIAADNASGGVREGGPKYAQDLNPGVNLDMQKLVGWDGAAININGVDRIGHTIRPDVGSIYDPVQIYGGQTYTLYNVTLEQSFPDKQGSFKFGRMSPGDDFAESPLYNYYVNAGIDGQIRAVILDTRFDTYPFATWGARLRFDPSPSFNVMTGIFEVSDHFTDRGLHGLDFGISHDDGFQLVQQFGWTPVFGEGAQTNDRTPGGSGHDTESGLPGHYFVGAYFSNSNYPQFGTSVLTRISYGFYAHADQMIYRPTDGSDAGLTVLGMIAAAPQPNVSIIPLQVSGGALYHGLFPERPKDVSILGFIHGEFSGDYADAVNFQQGGHPSSETDLELGYRVQVNQFTYVQPDIQYVIQPGGTGHVPNSVILAAQWGLTF